MNSITRYFLISSLLLGFACNHSEKPEITETSPNAQEQAKHKQSIVPNAAVKLEIEGMTCRMGCVSKINKTLTDLNGVMAPLIDFEEEREKNYATVKFDENLISKEEVIAAIEEIDYPVTSSEDQELN